MEEYIPWLKDAVVSYLNTDVAISGTVPDFDATPDLHSITTSIGKKIIWPYKGTKNRTLYDVWEETAGEIGIPGARSDYTSFVHLTTYLLPFLQKQSNPTSIIYTTSGLALAPINFCPNYCATKAALHHFVLVLREQMKDGGFDKLKVIEVFPPAVQTELHDADKQPYIENGRQLGLPLADFIAETWQGFEEGKEQIAVGTQGCLQPTILSSHSTHHFLFTSILDTMSEISPSVQELLV